MQSSTFNSVHYSQPFRLGEEELENPSKVIACFFKTYPLSVAKLRLADCVEVALSTDNPLYAQAEDRADLLQFYHFIEEMLEAVFVAERQNHD